MATEIEEKIELYQCNAIRITFFNNELSPEFVLRHFAIISMFMNHSKVLFATYSTVYNFKTIKDMMNPVGEIV